MPPTTWQRLENSLLLRMGGAVAAICLLALLGMTVSGLVAVSTQGSGEAINVAGSLRMQSWHMVSLYLADMEQVRPDTRREMAEAVHRFEATLGSPAIQAILARTGEDHLGTSYAGVHQTWHARIRPRFLALAVDAAVPTVPERALLHREVADFVERINQLVKHMEESTEAKILVMRVVLGVALVLTVLVALLTIHLVHIHFIQPLRDLLRMAADVGRGDLSSRTENTGEDELGQLGQAFNLMAEDLSKLYRDLEARVAQQTAELTRGNQSLELLYHSIARLHGAPPDKDTCLALLADIEAVLGLGHGVICLGEQGGEQGLAIASTLGAGDADPCVTAQCRWCHGTAETRVSLAQGFGQHLTLPLADTEQQYGVLILSIPPGRHLEAWQVQLLEALSRHIGVAIGAERRIEQGRRLALLEERAVIARELHDSLAQSLAYMKIQVSRLKTALRAQRSAEETDTVLEELREGLNSAYRQLRELLSTFRLRMENDPLGAVLARTSEEFAARGALSIQLEMRLESGSLSPNEEIHVLHIVREALANVLHHAGASQARVALSWTRDGRVRLEVDDDGRGIVKPADLHHYGMTIMEERARTLHGELRFEERPGGGTRVALEFTPIGRRQAERKIA